MVKRLSGKPFYYIAFALISLMLCWESGLTNAAVLNRDIPDQAIRLRILANSDAPEDQWVKLKIRDEVVKAMQGWVTQPEDIEEAREMVRAHLDEFDALVGDILHTYGFSPKRKVELAVVPFPTKVYGNKVYPAGDYEALRITLGDGNGQNWWCVLFPPLCFVDLVGGQTAAETKPAANRAPVTAASSDAGAAKSDPDASPTADADLNGTTANGNSASYESKADDDDERPEPEVRFYFWDKMVSTFHSLKLFF